MSGKSLSRKEKQELEESIANAKAKLAADKLSRPKRKLTQKQLENLRKGREANPHFHPKKASELSKKLEKSSKASNTSNGHVAVGYGK